MSPRKITKRRDYRYALDQCALFKVESKGKLATLLNTDLKSLQEIANNQDNYKLFTIEPKDEWSSAKSRSVQAPKTQLRKIHDRVFRLLRRVETPDFLHSAIVGRSYITNGQAHVGTLRALKVDIRSFYGSTTKDAIYKFFLRDMQCSDDVASLLAKVCTCHGVLPTGSPISTHMAYFVHRAMFEAFERCAHERSLTFTVYVDDMVFSGTNVSRATLPTLEKIAAQHGLELHPTKTRFFPAKSPKVVTGVIVLESGIRVPHIRLQKMKALSRAIKLAAPTDKLHLLEKLYGLVGEAALIENRFDAKWKNLRVELNNLRALVPKVKPVKRKLTPRQAGAYRALARRKPVSSIALKSSDVAP